MTDILDRKYIDNENKNMKYFKSLNAGSRKQRLTQITRENQQILKRILHRQPVYSHLTWKQSREQNKVYCKNICEYPYILPGTSQGSRSPTKRNRRRVQVRQEQYVDDQHIDDIEEEPLENLDEMILEQEREMRDEEVHDDVGFEDEIEDKEQEEEAEVNPEKLLQKEGELELTIVKVIEIKKGDLLSKPDPYVRIILDNQKVKTKTQKSTSNPEFNETFKLNVNDCTTAKVTLELWEDDLISDDNMGFVTIPLADLERDVEVSKEYQFEKGHPDTRIIVKLQPTFGNYVEY